MWSLTVSYARVGKNLEPRSPQRSAIALPGGGGCKMRNACELPPKPPFPSLKTIREYQGIAETYRRGSRRGRWFSSNRSVAPCRWWHDGNPGACLWRNREDPTMASVPTKRIKENHSFYAIRMSFIRGSFIFKIGPCPRARFSLSNIVRIFLLKSRRNSIDFVIREFYEKRRILIK